METPKLANHVPSAPISCGLKCLTLASTTVLLGSWLFPGSTNRIQAH